MGCTEHGRLAEPVSPARFGGRAGREQPRRDGRVPAGPRTKAHHHADVYAERTRWVRFTSQPPRLRFPDDDVGVFWRCRRSHWFHTIAMSRTELDRVFNNAAMKKRCIVTYLEYLNMLISPRP